MTLKENHMPYVGQPVKRFEDPRLVTGQGEYVDDVKLPGMTYAAFLRSPHAHAIIKSIDTSKALQAPGVEMVITGADLEGQISGIETRQLAEWEMDTLEVPDLPALANRKTFFVGETIACVIATERAIARDAVELIEVDYEPLPPILDPLEGADENSIPVHEKLGTNVTMRKYHDRQGEGLDDAFQRADRIVSQQYTVQRIAPFPMETRGCVAYHSAEDDLLTVWASTQGAHRVRDKLVQLLQLPREKVRVITNDVGGGFGEKGGVFPEDLVIAFAALRLHKPINWIADRRENMLTFHGRGHTVDMEAAVQNDGTLLAIRMKNVVDGGAFCGNSTTTPPYTSSHRIVGPYRTPAARVEVVGVITNKGPSGAYRGAGGPRVGLLHGAHHGPHRPGARPRPRGGKAQELHRPRVLPLPDPHGHHLRLWGVREVLGPRSRTLRLLRLARARPSKQGPLSKSRGSTDWRRARHRGEDGWRRG